MNIKEAKDIIRIAWRSKVPGVGRIPVLLEGETGIGKSSIVEQVAKEFGVPFWALNLMLIQAPDLTGLPMHEVKCKCSECGKEVIVAGTKIEFKCSGCGEAMEIIRRQTVYSVPKLLPPMDEKRGILCLEELNRCPEDIRSSALQLLSAGVLNEYIKPEGILVVACVNPADGESNYETVPLDAAILARVMLVRLQKDIKVWIKWAKANGVASSLLQVLDLSGSRSIWNYSNPRQLTYLGWQLAQQPDLLESESRLQGLVETYLPDKTLALAFSQNLMTVGIILDLGQILTMKDKALRAYCKTRLSRDDLQKEQLDRLVPEELAKACVDDNFQKLVNFLLLFEHGLVVPFLQRLQAYPESEVELADKVKTFSQKLAAAYTLQR